MKNLISSLILLSTTHAFANDLQNCEAKIAKIINQIPQTEAQISGQSRVDQYHLSQNRLNCPT